MNKGDVPTVGYPVREELFVRGEAAAVHSLSFGTKRFGKCSIKLKEGYWIIVEGKAVTVIPESQVVEVFVEAE